MTVDGGALDADDGTGTVAGPLDWSLQFAVSLIAVMGFALLFGVAVGGFVTTYEFLDATFGGFVQARLFVTGLALVPATSFLFVALYDDADLVTPGRSGRHPPMVDAWLLALAVFGGVTIGPYTPQWPAIVLRSATAVTLGAAYLLLPFWLARRCLRTPSWALGGLSALTAPLVLIVVAFSLAGEWVHGGDPWLALATAVAGTAVPYGLASASPGPQRLAAGLVRVVVRGGAAVRTLHGRLHGRHSE